MEWLVQRVVWASGELTVGPSFKVPPGAPGQGPERSKIGLVQHAPRHGVCWPLWKTLLQGSPLAVKCPSELSRKDDDQRVHSAS